jgi:RNase P/RNase MRP subunit POP5
MKSTRKRYVRFILHRQGPSVSERKLNSALWSNLLSLYGEICAADSKLYITEYDEKSGKGILQCNATTLREVLASASVLYSINSTHVSFAPLKTSGTIKGLTRR